MNDKQLAVEIAKEIDKAGGKTYFVGGCVRDKILKRENKDIDIEVYGITPKKLKGICSKYGQVDEIGISFGILKIHGYDIDISMPRTERKVGDGHKSFDVNVDPFMSEKEAAKRRDFTINSIMQNVLTGEYVDSFNGIEDLKEKKIQYVDSVTFIEDPLRVFRAAQFASRFKFSITEDTLNLCRKINVSSLSKERIFEETNKALLKADNPAIYFEILKETGHLKEFFPELETLIGVKQNPKHHPEGDVWNHTMLVINKASKVRSLSSNPLYFMYSALFHDIGKPISTTEENGSIKSIGHEIEGSKLSKQALSHLTNETNLINYVSNMVENHMKPHLINKKSSLKTTNRFFDKCINPYDQLLLGNCDTPIERIEEMELYDSGWWSDRLKSYKTLIKEPEVTGKDLIRLGYIPGPMFSLILKKCHLIHLAGVKKDDVIKQLPSIIKGIKQSK